MSTPREPLWAFLNTRIGIPWSSDFRGIGIVKNDCLVAVVGYNGFTGRSCFMHNAIDDPSVITRTFVQAIFEFPFVQCDLTHLLAVVGSSNEKAMKLDLKVGFKEMYRLEGAGLDNDDLVFLQMKRDECRWINGKEKRTPGS